MREERSTTSGFSGASGLMVQKLAFWAGPSVTRLFPTVPPPEVQVLLVACCTQQVEGGRRGVPLPRGENAVAM